MLRGMIVRYFTIACGCESVFGDKSSGVALLCLLGFVIAQRTRTESCGRAA